MNSSGFGAIFLSAIFAGMSRKQFTLGKTERLKSRRLIELLFKKGKGFNIFPLRVLYLFPEKDDNLLMPLQAGFTASSRNFKKATDRNRIKRLIKEAYRIHKRELAEVIEKENRKLIVFFIYTGRELPVYTTIEEKIKLVIEQLITITHAKNTSAT